MKAKIENLEDSDMKRQKFERENQDLIAELEKLTVIVDQYESLQAGLNILLFNFDIQQ